MERASGHVERTLPDGTGSKPVALWRLLLGGAVLLTLLTLGAFLAPVYLRNLELQRYVSALADDPRTRERDDSLIRSSLVDKADELKLPVRFENIGIVRSADDLRITVRYAIHVNLLLYTVDLHFYPGAGSR